MQKFIPLALVALLAIGCKGGEEGGTTAAGTTGSTTGTTVAPSADGTYTFKFAPKEGEKTSYVMTMDAGASMNMSMGMTMACEKAEADKFTMVSTFDDIKMSIGGKEAPAAATDMMKKMKVTSVMDGHGKAISTSVEGAPAGTRAPEVSGTVFPDKPVKIGDTWEGTTKMSGAEVKATYKLAKVDGNIATLEVTMGALPGGMTTDGPATTEIDMSTGMLNSR